MLESGAMSRAVYLPGSGPWYNSQTGALVKPDVSDRLHVPVTMDDVPSYLRGGYILPLRVRCPPVLSTRLISHLPERSWICCFLTVSLQPEEKFG